MLLALVMVAGLVACGNKEAAPEATTGTKPEAATEATPEAAPEAGKITGTLEVAAFSNCDLNDQYWAAAKEEFNKLYPDCEVKLILSANTEESMRPRFINDNPPDVYFMGGQANADIAPLTAEGKLMDLTDWYNTVEAIGYTDRSCAESDPAFAGAV